MYHLEQVPTVARYDLDIIGTSDFSHSLEFFDCASYRFLSAVR